MDKENKKKIILISLIALGVIIAVTVGSLIYLGVTGDRTSSESSESQSTNNYIDYDADDPNKEEEFVKKLPPRDDLTEEEMKKLKDSGAVAPPKLD